MKLSSTSPYSKGKMSESLFLVNLNIARKEFSKLYSKGTQVSSASECFLKALMRTGYNFRIIKGEKLKYQNAFLRKEKSESGDFSQDIPIT